MVTDWTVGLRLWLERSGRAILGPGRLELLEWIDRCHSISGAARQMGMSYRRAWLLVESVNRAAGQELVSTKTGGARGGGAELTPEGRLAVTAFRDLQDRLRRTAASLWPRALPPAERVAVHVAAAVSLEEVLGRLAVDFALYYPSIQVRFVYGASDELAEHVLAGTSAHLFISADLGPVEWLRKASLVHGRSVALAENSLAAVAGPSWSGSLRKPGDLRRPEVNCLVLAGPASPLGRYSRLFLEKEGLWQELQPRLVMVDNSRAVIAALHAGQAPLGFIYGSDLVQATGCRLLFRVRQNNAPIRYHAALVQGHAEPAQTFLKFLTSPRAGKRFRECGFLPVRGSGKMS